jgi:hypothetical protein
MQWLVLMVILLGTILSSVGGMKSHGLAAIEATHYVALFTSNGSHEHEHEEANSELDTVNQPEAADHAHHTADHSHDKARTLPAAWSLSTPQLPSWLGQVRPWIEMVWASRLERPPMG